MTNSEAIKILKANYPDSCFGYLCEAVDTAIYALSVHHKTGRWIKRTGGALGYNCSCCGKSDISNRFDYCPNCGAYMKGEKDAAGN